MSRLKTILFSVFLLSICIVEKSFSAEYLHLKSETGLSRSELAQKIAPNTIIILGEFHYNEFIQQEQALLTENIVNNLNRKGEFSLGWEFLNAKDQERIKQGLQLYQDNELNDDGFLQHLFPTSQNPFKNTSYLPILKVVRDLEGDLRGVNAPRSLKSRIINNGLGSLAPHERPPIVEIGGGNYWERFETAMGNHVPADKLYSYFIAQCFTDSVMSHSLIMDTKNDLKFLVVGAFHSDYFSGVVKRIKSQTNMDVIVVKFVDQSILSESEIEGLKNKHEKYGFVADYLAII